MKISIITLHAVHNYGSALQAYATERIFRQIGLEAEIVDYRRTAVLPVSAFDILKSSDVLKSKIKRLLMKPSSIKAQKVFEPFIRKNLSLSPVRYTEDSDFGNYPLSADVYCTGSDQVWNTDWHEEVPKPFFLSFVPDNKKKIAFSASFGKSELEEWEKKTIQELLSRYSAISVRERSGLDILRNLGFEKAQQVLDPTQFLTVKDWNKLACTDRIVSEPYILVYQLCNNRMFEEYAKKLSKKKGIKLIRLCTRYDQIRKPGHGIVLPPVGDFITLIRDAEYVLTDSFHCTSFSILFHKQFMCFSPNRFSTRLTSILELTGLENRMLHNATDFETISQMIDYSKPDRILDEKRNEGIRFLKDALDIN